MAAFLFVGLGNPGAQYAKTRHNAGFMVLEAFAKRRGWAWSESARMEGRYCRGNVGDNRVHLLLPQTYMNESGRSVHAYMNYYRLSVNRVLVVIDDTGLPLGRLRLRGEGSPGGHNGLKSVQEWLGTAGYPRLRFGIGEPERQEKSDYVLDRFTKEEELLLPSLIGQAVDALELVLTRRWEEVMNQVNSFS